MVLESRPPALAPWPPNEPCTRLPVGASHSESFSTIAKDANLAVWYLIEFNFKTRNPREVNWYLREYVGCVNTTRDGKNYVFFGARPREKAAIYVPDRNGSPISKWPLEKKLEEAIRRSFKMMPAETAHVLEAMLTPEALAGMAALAVAFAASQFIGIGEIVDLILTGASVIVLELVGWDAAFELQDFFSDAENANSEKDLESAARHFAKAVSELGVQLILAILFKKRSKKTFRQSQGFPKTTFANLPKTPGRLFYRSKVVGDPTMRAGYGRTSLVSGDIWYSTKGTASEQKLALIHEKVHSLLTPKLQILRGFRARLRANSYDKSYLLKYLEEALCETVGQLSVKNPMAFITGIAFPVTHGYVTVSQMGAELAGILVGPINVAGQIYLVKFSESKPAPPPRAD